MDRSLLGVVACVAIAWGCGDDGMTPGGVATAGVGASGTGGMSAAGAGAGAGGTGGGGRPSASAGAAAAGRGAAPAAGAAAGAAGGGTAGGGADDDAGVPNAGGGGAGAAAAGGGGSAGTPAAGSGGSAGTKPHEKFVGNITTRGMVRSDFAQYWDQITPENEGKWASVEPTRDTMNWAGVDAVYQYAKQQGIPFKQHTFVWGSQAPSWIGSLPPAEQAAEVEEWIRAFCERYPDVRLIDVVNEPDHALPSFIDAIGGRGASGHDWVLWSFRKARQYCPNAVLILNDFNVLRWETDKFIAIANKVKAEGLLDAVGAQAHGLETQMTSELKANLAKLIAVGVPVYISEYDLDIADDAQQKMVMEQQFPLFWEAREVVGITLWGYIHGTTWRPNTGLIRNDVPRPAMTWLMEYLGR